MKITRRQLRQIILQEVRIKPNAINIPPQHLDKIHSLIADGEFEQAQSFIDAFGGPPDYVDSYMAYEKVGDLEKLGNEAAGILSEPGYRYDDVQAVDDRARVIARNASKGFESQNDRLDAFYHSYYDRYAKNRNKEHLNAIPQHRDPDMFLEHRIKPSVANIPPEHLDKIHSLIDGGRLAQAQSFIDAFGGDPDYVDNYIAYGEVGDLEKLGNKAAEMYQQPPEKPGLKPGYTYRDALSNHDLARSISRKYASREFPDGGPDALDTELRHYYDRYIPNVNKSSATYSDMFLEHKLLQEMAVRRILEIEMTDQLYLVHPDLPGGRLPLGQSVDALIEALYRMTGEGYTHVVMATDLRDFNRDRSVFPYGIYTALSKAIRVLEYNRDPRSLFLQRSQ